MPKHSTTWSNSAVIRTLARGRWDRMARQRSEPGKSGVVTYLDKKGRKRCHGTPQLKRSQSLDWMHETSNILFLPCWFLPYYSTLNAFSSGATRLVMPEHWSIFFLCFDVVRTSSKCQRHTLMGLHSVLII